MKKIIISTFLAAMASLPVMALDLDLTVKGDGLRVLTEKEAPEGFGRGLPMGPGALRFDGASLWAADSLTGRLVEFDAGGKEIRKISINGGDQLVIADFATIKDRDGKTEGFWALGSERPELVKIDLTGKILASFSTELSIQARLELLPGNRLAVLDQGMSQIAVFDETGKQLFKQSAVGKGFAAAANGDILFLNQEGEVVVLCKRTDANGQVEKLAELPISIESNPSLILSLANDELLIGFHSFDEEKAEASYNISRMNTAGKITATMTTPFPAAFIGRTVIDDGKNLFLVSFVEETGKYLLRLSEFAPTLIEEAAEG